jgi:hypothetical protein
MTAERDIAFVFTVFAFFVSHTKDSVEAFLTKGIDSKPLLHFPDETSHV